MREGMVYSGCVACRDAPEPGLAPVGDSLSFASPKESKPRKGDPVVRVPSLRYGQPAMLARGACRETHFAPMALRSDRRGKSVHEGVRPAAHARPTRCASRHGQKGVGTGSGYGIGCGNQGRGAERSDGPCPAPQPLGLRLWRGVCGGRMRVEARMLRHHACRGCPNEALQARSEFRGTRRKRADAGCPERQRRVADPGVAFLLGTFLWRSKEKNLARRGETRLRRIRADVVAKAHCGVQGHTRDAT